MGYKNISNEYCKIQETTIRDAIKSGVELKQAFINLGVEIGKRILADCCTTTTIVTTPMEAQYSGLAIDKVKENVIISTKDDFEYFAKGIALQFCDPYRGYINYSGVRGPELKYSKMLGENICLPEIKSGKAVANVIIAKSVIASGCTAIDLAKRAYSKYVPSHLIIASIFYSEKGIAELRMSLPSLEIYTIASKADVVDCDGMLHPGIGNVDARLCS